MTNVETDRVAEHREAVLRWRAFPIVSFDIVNKFTDDVDALIAAVEYKVRVEMGMSQQDDALAVARERWLDGRDPRYVEAPSAFDAGWINGRAFERNYGARAHHSPTEGETR